MQKKYKEILVEQEALRRSIQERQDMTHQYQQRSEKLEQNLLDDQERYRLKLEAEKVWTDDRHHHTCNILLGQTSEATCST